MPDTKRDIPLEEKVFARTNRILHQADFPSRIVKSRAIDFDMGIQFREKTIDPPDPGEGSATIWMSDGTGSGDDGDIMIKITAGGTTKTGTLIDFSGI